MCGRYSLAAEPAVIEPLFGLETVENLPARYNIAPGQEVPIVGRFPEDEPQRPRELRLVRWGLPRRRGAGGDLINARSETVFDRSAFRRAAQQQRCLVPADGFYEWQKDGRSKQPFHIRRRDGGPFAMAGIWDTTRGPAGEVILACAILTAEANALVGPLHDRMPVVVAERDYALWLDPEVQTEEALETVLAPWPDQGWEAVPVSRLVNSVANDDPSLIVEHEEKTPQLGFGF